MSCDISRFKLALPEYDDVCLEGIEISVFVLSAVKECYAQSGIHGINKLTNTNLSSSLLLPLSELSSISISGVILSIVWKCGLLY